MTRREQIRAVLSAHPDGVLVGFLAATIARPGAPAGGAPADLRHPGAHGGLGRAGADRPARQRDPG